MLNARLNSDQLKLHEKAIALSSRHRRLEAEIVCVLADIEKDRIYKLLGYSSLFVYAVNALGLSEALAYSFIAVARKARDCELLNKVIQGRELSISKAARIVSALTADNAVALVEFTKSHTSREIDCEVARLRPQSRRTQDRIKPVAEGRACMECEISHGVSGKLRRAQSLLSSKLGRAVDFNATLERALDEFLERHDPVVKAEKAFERKTKGSAARAAKPTKQLCSRRVASKRQPLSAAQRHAVARRDKGRCTFFDPNTGQRCASDRWLHAHHIVPVSQGGGNEPENLQTLCAAHHDLLHQLALPV